MAVIIPEGPWKLGLNSVDSPGDLLQGQYQWAVNCINKGGVIATRPGQKVISMNTGLSANPAKARGMKLFTPRGGPPVLVIAIDGKIYYYRHPFTAGTALTVLDSNLNPLQFDPGANIEFEVAVLGVTQDASGNITAIDPYPVLMICDGSTRTAFWDGAYARHLDPDPSGAHETPICSWMKWIGNRLWTMKGRKIRVSDLLNPLKFSEEDLTAEGGYFNLPGDGTGFGVTPDFRSLLAFTDFTTTSFQAGILNRATWSSTQDFQKVIFSDIGCAAGRSIVNQYGMAWWYSHGGLINLDSALQTYRSSEIKFKDKSMKRSAINLGGDISGICATAYENYLLISVPSGDLHNYHTWVMDGNPNDSMDSPAQWSSIWTGVRPTQYATGVVEGKLRCFAFSKDSPPLNHSFLSLPNVWELFLKDRRDIGFDNLDAAAIKNIQCGFETRLIPTGQLSEIKYVELDLEEIIGTVQIDIYYATRRGTYKRFGTKQIVGTVGSVTASMIVPVPFAQYLPQKRTVKSENESILSSDTNPIVETPHTRNIDRHFSFLVKWSGQMSISAMRIHAEPIPEQMDGAFEANETTDRYIRPSGTGAILSTGPVALPILDQQSGFTLTSTPRWSEELYQSLT